MAGLRSARSSVKQQPTSPLLSDQAYDAIRDKIVTLEIAPGAPIEEEQLAAELGVGRTPVREAIKRLAYRNWSWSIRAAEATPPNWISLTWRRSAISGSASRGLRPSARRPKRVTRNGRNCTISSMTSTPAPTPASCSTSTCVVHRAIHRMAHNPYLLDTLTGSLDLSLRMWNLARERLPDLDHHVHGQTEVLQAILDRNGARARKLAEAHVREFEDDIRKMF